MPRTAGHEQDARGMEGRWAWGPDGNSMKLEWGSGGMRGKTANEQDCPAFGIQLMVKGADDPENDADESSIPGEAESRQAIEQSQFIEHMVRCWDAERDNAERITRKVSIIVSGLPLLFGPGIFIDRMD